jgi:very-short-patch-repair endonuclease
LADDQDGVVHRRQLRSLGIGRDDVRAEVLAGRWRILGRHTVLVRSQPLTPTATRWHAVWEVGAGAALDGVAALMSSGLTGFHSDRLDVSIPHANRHHRLPGVTSHRRRVMPPTIGAGIPRVAPVHAAIHAAQWAASDRQAALVLCLVVQQRLVRPADLLAAWGAVTRSRRRALIASVVADLCTGAHSLGELDFAAWCRRRGLPTPTRQVVRTTARGRIYLDVAWEDIGLVVEIDGGHHASALAPVDDALRQNEVVINGATVLRIPVIGLRLAPDRFLAQVVRAHARLTRAAA